MSRLSNVWLVAGREIRERGRSKAFLFSSAAVLVLVAALVVLPGLLSGGTDEYTVGTVGEGNDEIIAGAETLANANDEPDEEPSVSITTVSFGSREEAAVATEAGEVDAVLIDGDEILVESAFGFGDSPLVSLLQQGAASVELRAIVAEGGETAADVIEIMTSDPLETTSISGEDPTDETRGVVAYAGLMLLYIAVLLYGTWILTGVTEEKSNRVVEVLLSSVRPWQLLGGKILGIGFLGLTQFAGTIVVAVTVIRITGAFDLPNLNLGSVVNLVVWFVLGFLLFAVMFGSAGALVSRTEEAQAVAFPMSLTAVAGFFLALATLNDPTGPAAIIGTFIPLTAPFVVPVRAALDAIPAWQYAAAVLLTAGTIVGLTFVGGRIYSGALLRYGGRTKLREAWRSAAE